MGFANPKGRDWSLLVNWDGLGKLYAAIIITWTVLLCTGMGWLIRHRHQPLLTIRKIPLAIASTTLLHVYLVKIFLAYTTNGHFPCSLEFWIMSIYLPFGIALFQANMAQLQSVSSQQMRLLKEPRFSLQSTVISEQQETRSRWARWRATTLVHKTEILIGMGMLVQLIVTTCIYVTSPKLHGDWGNIPFPKGQAECRKGPEWIPSAIWQLVWAWFYGPFILFKIRKVRDAHYWYIQTILCVISGLPGSPLWLASLYVPSFHKVNRFWVPPMWLAPGIIVMQAVTVFLPIYEAYESRSQTRITINLIESWERRKESDEYTFASGSTEHFVTKAEKGASVSDHDFRKREMYTMGALEKALEVNPIPLLEFAATKDFTAENIVFLRQLREWRNSWSVARRYGSFITDQDHHRLFEMAVEIYSTSICNKTAEFPLNIEGKIRSELDNIFGPAMSDTRKGGETSAADSITPPASFEEVPRTPTSVITGKGYAGSITTFPRSQRSNSAAEKETVRFAVHPCVRPLAPNISPGFEENVFNAAEQSIKYLVLTNTWRKFVDNSKEHLLEP